MVNSFVNDKLKSRGVSGLNPRCDPTLQKACSILKPRRESCSCDSSPIILTAICASRISGLTFTPTTVTSCTRGSRNSVRIDAATTSRMASAAFNKRLLVTEDKWVGDERGSPLHCQMVNLVQGQARPARQLSRSRFAAVIPPAPE